MPTVFQLRGMFCLLSLQAVGLETNSSEERITVQHRHRPVSIAGLWLGYRRLNRFDLASQLPPLTLLPVQYAFDFVDVDT